MDPSITRFTGPDNQLPQKSQKSKSPTCPTPPSKMDPYGISDPPPPYETPNPPNPSPSPETAYLIHSPYHSICLPIRSPTTSIQGIPYTQILSDIQSWGWKTESISKSSPRFIDIMRHYTTYDKLILGPSGTYTVKAYRLSEDQNRV